MQPISKCRECGKDSDHTIIFHIEGNIRVHDAKNYGGIVGGNISTEKTPEKWEEQRDGLVAKSEDNTLRVHKLLYCKMCLLKIITRVR